MQLPNAAQPMRALLRIWLLTSLCVCWVLPSLADSESGLDEPVEVDVVFVLDNSGSMRRNDPNFLTRAAVSDFARALDAQPNISGRIALVLFDGQARLIQELTPTDAGGDLPGIEFRLSALDFSGQRTNSPVGIERALYELRENGRPQARKAIVLLSDGQIDTGNPDGDREAGRWLREELAEDSWSEGIQIFGIAFTDAADYQLMQALALKTQARYYRAYQAADLSAVVDDVMQQVSVESLALDETSPETEPSLAALPDVAAASPTSAMATGTGAGGANGEGGGFGVLGWVPVAILLVGGALLWRRRLAAATSGAFSLPPAAQLLDPAGRFGEAGGALPLRRGRTRIGRDSHNELVLGDDTISSEHAVVEVRKGRYWIEDRRSTNGTWLAGKRLEAGKRAQLKGGDRLRFAEIDLMFVLPGYVPGGATVFLNSSTSAPPGWQPPEKVEPPASAASKASLDADESPASSTGEVRDAAFVARREQLDPASILDLDEDLDVVAPSNPSPSQNPSHSASIHGLAAGGDDLFRVGMPDSDNVSEDPPPVEQVMVDLKTEEPGFPETSAADDPPADSASAAVHAFDELTEPEFEDLPAETEAESDPEPRPSASSENDVADHTPVIPIHFARSGSKPRAEGDGTDSSPTADIGLYRQCLDFHLDRVTQISTPFADFTDRAFGEEIREALATSARDLMKQAADDAGIAQSTYTRSGIRYVICAVPDRMEMARDRFAAAFGGFTRMLTEHLQAESFRTDRCEILAVLTFGRNGGAPWVSLSIVPDDGREPRIDLLSYEFLTDVERREIENAPNVEISQSGLA